MPAMIAKGAGDGTSGPPLSPKTDQQILTETIAGAGKALTTDMIDFLASGATQPGRPITEQITQKKMVEGDKIFEAVTGYKPTGSFAELAGSMINPEMATKAMVVGALRLGRNVEKATNLKNVGAKMADIFDSTGVYFDKDGIGKAVLSDKNSYLKPDALTTLSGGTPTTLEELLVHPQLFDTYPELRNMHIDNYTGTKNQGRYSNKEISLNTANTPEDIHDILLHETQHAIQDVEGFGRGGSPSQFLGFDPASIQQKINTARVTGDPAVIAAAERFKTTANIKLREATNRYSNIPGEQEARFTQATMDFDNTQLQSDVLKLLRGGDTPQTWDTRPISPLPSGDIGGEVIGWGQGKK